MGKLRSNFAGTEYTLYDAGENPTDLLAAKADEMAAAAGAPRRGLIGKSGAAGKAGADEEDEEEGSKARLELCCIMYDMKKKKEVSARPAERASERGLQCSQRPA